MGNFLRLHPDDNVVVALRNLEKNELLTDTMNKISVRQAVPALLKIAATELPEGEKVFKYGMCIGIAVCRILKGEIVHTHNLKSNYNFETKFDG